MCRTGFLSTFVNGGPSESNMMAMAQGVKMGYRPLRSVFFQVNSEWMEFAS